VCKELGFRIPQDIAVIGSTGVELAAHTDPPLTVLAMPMEEMGRQAAKMLTKMLDKGISHLLGQRIPCPLIIRESLVPPEEIQEAMRNDYLSKIQEFDHLVVPNQE
jgi:DNA-binding LacI/PurR family transcriptional regulator